MLFVGVLSLCFIATCVHIHAYVQSSTKSCGSKLRFWLILKMVVKKNEFEFLCISQYKFNFRFGFNLNLQLTRICQELLQLMNLLVPITSKEKAF